MKEVKMTTREGNSGITLVTEDMFLYGSTNGRFVPNKEAVLKLVKTVAEYPGVKAVQPSHMSLAPVVCDPSMVKETAEILIHRN